MKKLLKLGALCGICGICGICGLLFVSSVSAQQPPTVGCTPAGGGDHCAFASRVRLALDELDLSARGWHIVIVNEEEWAALAASRRRAGSELHSKFSFSLLALRRTYLRQAAFPQEPEARLRDVLAHEWAHLRVCGSSESCAAETSARIARLVAAEEQP